MVMMCVCIEGIVTTITVWQTAFPKDDVPAAISYVQVSAGMRYECTVEVELSNEGVNDNESGHDFSKQCSLQAIDFFLDRCRTSVNVISDIFVVGMLQHIIDKEVRQQAAGTSSADKDSIELVETK
mmetsp:Transcript_10461/g.17206  ORF Transcript_10461/g.17206 Transcript_10461/m.17206 type:complete len:126 (-) Transcript_10461:17-394(-)